MASAAAADGSATPASPARSAVRDRTAFRFVQRTATAITGKGRSASHGILEATVVIKRLENSMNPEIEWNSSKL
jgi:hypothetical protein